MVRKPAVAGQFYPGEEQSLRETVAALVPEAEARPAFGVVSPHAGYVYSGAIAGAVFSCVHVPETVVILGPNHHGVGQRAAVYPGGAWETPLGRSEIDAELSRNLVQSCDLLQEDEAAHRFEHSLEVQLPFLQFLNPSLRIVPLCLSHTRPDDLVRLGEQMADVLEKDGREILLVASSDMTHYESAQDAQRKDTAAIDRILALDPVGLYRVVAEQGITMCGVVPTVVMLSACNRLGAKKATLVRYGNSGDVTGDRREVVGYAGLVVE
ncbi:MAG: AmmeMemoRadiSam system protein B [Geoalkalibacter sp.]|jgi:AmmeMemoRadiSam system protein B|uniref:AmmeMemoRadiSam system protein B n=1 Tax=Geoalkalibacter sp. TaxID=3041440 RepID=UPI002A928668|nr:AmmeMemoRadiSam system protein B [Thermodesulfobacteriota bacterium]